MAEWAFKIGSNVFDLGLFEVNSAKVNNNTVLPGTYGSEAPLVITMLVSYRVYTITGRFIGSESEIEDFIDELDDAETDPSTGNPKQCSLKKRWKSTYTNVWVSAFVYDDTKATPGYIDYILELTEGSPIV